jgi:rubrerythrin
MNSQEILTAALKLEEDGFSFYEEIAAKAPNEYAKKTFESFAADEKNHIAWINKMAEGENVELDSGNIQANRIYDTLKGIFAGIPEDQKGRLAAADDDIAQIDIAISKEEGAIEAYSGWAESADDEKVKELFAALTQVEKAHRELLNNAKTYLNSTGDWFMEQEGWSFDGA